MSRTFEPLPVPWPVPWRTRLVDFAAPWRTRLRHHPPAPEVRKAAEHERPHLGRILRAPDGLRAPGPGGGADNGRLHVCVGCRAGLAPTIACPRNMSHPLDGPRLKLQRSEEHLNDLRAAYDAHSAEAQSYVAVGSQELGQDGTWWHVNRCTAAPEPPAHWGLLAGDAVHNARSALDHLACRLVECNDRTATRQTSFPLWEQEPSNPNQQRRFDSCIRGMSSQHQEAVRHLQPYLRPGTAEAWKLTILADLDNLDKHRLIMPVTAVIPLRDIEAPEFQARFPHEGIEYRWNAGARLAPGVELFRWRALAGRHSVHGITAHVPARATYHDPNLGLRELREIRHYCVGIVESFALDLT